MIKKVRGDNPDQLGYIKKQIKEVKNNEKN
jgi:hypothetical protein